MLNLTGATPLPKTQKNPPPANSPPPPPQTPHPHPPQAPLAPPLSAKNTSTDQRPNLITSGKGGQIDLAKTSTPFGPRFLWHGKTLFQQSMLSAERRWEIPQTLDTIDPDSKHYNAKSAYAKTLRRDGENWGNA